MENSPNLQLPYIMPSQAQKHVTHNEALHLLDALVHLAVLDRDLTEPPASPSEGDRYIVAATAGDAWEGADGKIAVSRDGGWIFLDPRPGWLATLIDEATMVWWDGTGWRGLSGAIATLQNLALLGIGATADATNPFSARLNKALWTALATADGGTGDLRYTLNKQGTANVLSILMQSGWSGRAEIGLVGDDDLAIKVSADGTEWREALRIDRQSGKLDFPATNMLRDFAINLYPDSGRFAGPSATGVTIGAFVENPLIARYNGTAVASAGKFVSNNSDYGGTAGALPATAKDLIDKIRAVPQRRLNLEFHIAEYTMGSGTASSPVNIGGTNYWFSMFPAQGAMVPRMTFHAYVRAIDAPILWKVVNGSTSTIDGGAPVTADQLIDPSDGWVSVVNHYEADPYTSHGYQPHLFAIHAATAGDRYQIACPAAMAGITRVDPNAGVIAGISRWAA